MKVAMVTGSYPPQRCGIGDHAERLAQTLIAEGLTVEVLTTRCEERSAPGLVRYEVDNWKRGNWRCAIEWLGDQSYDVAHLQYPGRDYGHGPELAWLTCRLKRRLPKLPLVVTVHEYLATHWLRKLTVATIVPPAEAVIFPAETERKACANAMPWIRNKARVINIAPVIPVVEVSAEQRKELRARYGVTADNVLVGHFGFMQPNKGVGWLLRAFAQVYRGHPEVRLLMMCLSDTERDPFHAKLLNLVDSLGVAGTVIWTGFLLPEDVSRHFACCDLAAFPYRDGVSLRRSSFLTSMLHGLPTVTTLGDAPQEELQLTHGEEALLLPAGGTTESLAQAMTTLVESQPLRDKLKAAGSRWVQPFRWKSVARKTLEVYESVVR